MESATHAAHRLHIGTWQQFHLQGLQETVPAYRALHFFLDHSFFFSLQVYQITPLPRVLHG